eukprot:13690445-Alexandrium_andersonii.AAC.1
MHTASPILDTAKSLEPFEASTAQAQERPQRLHPRLPRAPAPCAAPPPGEEGQDAAESAPKALEAC